MRKLLSLAAAVSALAAVPAAAQYSQNGQYGTQANVNAGGTIGIQNRIVQLDSRLQAGIQSGAINRQEAQSIRPQLRQLRQLERQYSVNGLTRQEREDLQQRIRSVRQQLRAADGGGNGQYAQWDREDDSYGQRGYERQDPYYGQRGYERGYERQDGYDRRDEYGQRGYERQDGDYGRGGPYEQAEQVCDQRRGGLGGIIGGIFGRNEDCGLRVGQRASGNLYSLPFEYRNQFRDGNGAYFRTDGRAIYQIDARTNTVVRVYDMNR